MNQVADYAASIIANNFPESNARRMIIQHLGIFSRFDMNMCAISLAFGNIRSIAQEVLCDEKNKSDCAEAIEKIKIIADSLHNVAGFMLRGDACDAMHLYDHGRDENWPTGIQKNSTHVALKFFPNVMRSSEEYKNLFLTLDEFEGMIKSKKTFNL